MMSMRVSCQPTEICAFTDWNCICCWFCRHQHGSQSTQFVCIEITKCMPNENRNIVNICVWNVDRLVRGHFFFSSDPVFNALRWGYVSAIGSDINTVDAGCRTKKKRWEASDSISMQFSQKPWKIYYVTCYLLWNWVQYLLFKRGHWCPRHACIQHRTCFSECAHFCHQYDVYSSLFTRTVPTMQWNELFAMLNMKFRHDDYHRHNDKIAIRRCSKWWIGAHFELHYSSMVNAIKTEWIGSSFRITRA